MRMTFGGQEEKEEVMIPIRDLLVFRCFTHKHTHDLLIHH